MVEVKFCGMTRQDDVTAAVQLGATYVGAVMTESRRRVTVDEARALFEVLSGSGVRSVGVFGDEPAGVILAAVRDTGCRVVQLHGRAAQPHLIDRLREERGVVVWEVVRVGPDGLGAGAHAPSSLSDGVVLDTMGRGASLGGTGEAFDWAAVAGDVRDLRFGRCLVVAGGLRPENVKDAITMLAPDVVDVSSGVESAPGIKDHRRMAAFMAAVRAANPAPLT